MDRLTQLQDTLDDVRSHRISLNTCTANTSTNNPQLLTQMYASLNYIQQKHPYGEFEGQYKSADLVNFTSKPSNRANGNSNNTSNSTMTSTNTEANGTAKANADKKDDKKDDKKEDDEKTDGVPTHIPDEPDVFESTMREMARSLILQEQKAEILINSMPGIGHSEEKQKARMAALMEELKHVEGERAKAEEERERMIETLGEVIVGVQRVR
jgi:mediator of RNA polymerase II transcription subunit 21